MPSLPVPTFMTSQISFLCRPEMFFPIKTLCCHKHHSNFTLLLIKSPARKGNRHNNITISTICITIYEYTRICYTVFVHRGVQYHQVISYIIGQTTQLVQLVSSNHRLQIGVRTPAKLRQTIGTSKDVSQISDDAWSYRFYMHQEIHRLVFRPKFSQPQESILCNKQSTCGNSWRSHQYVR